MRNKTIDVEVAEKVMGFVVSGSPELVARSQEEMRGGRYWNLPAYSTSIAHAFQVRQRMRELGFGFRLSDADNGRSAASFFHDDAEQGLAGAVVADTDVLAICQAALQAVQERLEQPAAKTS